MTNFKIVKSIETDFDIKITKFKSTSTGLTAILVDRQGIIDSKMRYCIICDQCWALDWNTTGLDCPGLKLLDIVHREPVAVQGLRLRGRRVRRLQHASKLRRSFERRV